MTARVSNTTDIIVRRARRTDSDRLADLSGQLGYPVTKREMGKRLNLVLKHKAGACFVAHSREHNQIIGWTHVSTTPLVEVEKRAEINGMVVDEKIRSRGAGRLLLEAAEEWARKRGCLHMSVRSNVLRERAHGFYEKNGYEHLKTQKAFRKRL